MLQGWTLTKAAAAAESASAARVSGSGATAPKASSGCSTAPRRRARSLTAPPSSASQAIAALRRLRFTGPEIAELLGMALSTVSGILTRIGMGKLGRLGLEPAQRYERQRPGELIHIDVKKLGRIEGGAGKRVTGRPRHNWARTDRAAAPQDGRLGIRAHRDRRLHPPRLRRGAARREGHHRGRVPAPCAARSSPPRHPGRAADHRQRLGLPLDGPRVACRALGIRHLRTRPYRPQTNGKAERFIRTLLGGWAYGAIYRTSPERTAALDGWLWHYNHLPPTLSPRPQPPIARLNERTNLLGLTAREPRPRCRSCRPRSR